MSVDFWTWLRTAWLVWVLGFLAISGGCLKKGSAVRREPVHSPAPVAQPSVVSGATDDYRQSLDRQQLAAASQVIACCSSAQAFTRANAMEAAEYLDPAKRQPLLQLGLSDSHPAVRYAALVLAGRQKVADLVPSAERLRSDSDLSVRGAAIYMLHRCGQKVDLTPIGAMLFDKRIGVRANGAMLLSLIGDPDAIPMLKESARITTAKMAAVQEAIVRVQISEAIGKLGDDTVLDSIRAASYSQFDEVRILAVAAIGELGDRRFEAAIQQILLERPVELQLASAQSLARFGRYEALDLVLQSSMMDIPTVRGQAALALGDFPDQRAAVRLGQMLGDRQETVRLSAAAAILRAQSRLKN